MPPKPLDHESINENVKKVAYAVRGELYLRASELQKEGKKVCFSYQPNLCFLLCDWFIEYNWFRVDFWFYVNSLRKCKVFLIPICKLAINFWWIRSNWYIGLVLVALLVHTTSNNLLVPSKNATSNFSSVYWFQDCTLNRNLPSEVHVCCTIAEYYYISTSPG